MNVKSLISNLLDLPKSASFVLVMLLSFTTCHQITAAYKIADKGMLCDGGPITSGDDDDSDDETPPVKK